MGRPVIAILFVLAMFVTLYRGAVWSFVTVYLPTLLLLSATPEINLPSLPDMSARVAVIYGIIAGLVVKGGEPLPFRFGLPDLLILLLTASSVVTAILTEKWWTGVNVFGEQFLNFVAPYFLARAMFHVPEARRRALWICVTIVGVLAFLSLIELRLYPFFITRLLKGLGLYIGQNTMVLKRFALFRTQLTFNHPIDTGNCGMLLAAMIALFAATTSIGLRNLYVQLGILAALGISATSMSWSSYFGTFTAVALFVAIWLVPFTARLLPIVVACMIIVGFWGANRLENMQLGERTDVGQSFSDSLWIRASIMQNSWPFATSAGGFGYGKTIKKSELNLDSVDNGYLLFTMTRRWLFLAMFLMLPIVLGWRVAWTFARTSLPQHQLPVAIAASAVLGTMVAMFTVWFGFVYSYLWLMMLAMAHSALDVLRYGAPQQAPVQAVIQLRRHVIRREPALAMS